MISAVTPATNVPSFDVLDAYVARKLLSRSDQGRLSLYNYTDQCAFDGAWDSVTRRCRGLILDRDTREVVALPFDKFFNYGEHGVTHDLPDRPPDVTTVKYDGSLGICYRLDGKLRWATRGSFYSTQAAAAERLWAQRHSQAVVPDNFTLLVEIIAAESKNIVQYDTEKLVLLGVRDRFTGADLSYDDLQTWADRWGMPLTERITGGLQELIDHVAQMDASEEGFVARWGDYRVKLKSSQYLRLARVIQGLTERRVAEYWFARKWTSPPADVPAAEQRRLSGMPVDIPEEFAIDLIRQLRDLDAELQKVEAEFEAEWAAVAGEKERKVLVAKIQSKTQYFSHIMSRFSGKKPDMRDKVFTGRFGGHPRPV